MGRARLMNRTAITPRLLQAVGATTARAAIYAPLLDAALLVPGDAFNSITSRAGVCMLVAQLAHESGGFATTTENLNYRAEALVPVFGAHRISQAVANRIGRTNTQTADQQAIANTVYAAAWGRANLGNTEPGDGWRFRGGGADPVNRPGELRGLGRGASEWTKRPSLSARRREPWLLP